jgi:hypothetical protein
MTDEEALRLVQKVTALPGFTRGIGTRVVAARPGYVTMALERRPDLLQPQGHFHGGVISALADHAAGGAVTTAFPAGRFAVTVDLHVNFLAPAEHHRCGPGRDLCCLAAGPPDLRGRSRHHAGRRNAGRGALNGRNWRSGQGRANLAAELTCEKPCSLSTSLPAPVRLPR